MGERRGGGGASDESAACRSILDHLPELICRWGPRGDIIYANAAFCRNLGVAPRDAIGADLFSLLDNSAGEHLRAAMAGLTRQRPCAQRDEAVDETGTRWLRWSNCVAFERDGGVAYWQMVGRDITEERAARRAADDAEQRFSARRTLEQVLPDSHARMRALVEVWRDGVVVVGGDGVVRFVNAAAARLFGRRKRELVGTTCGFPLTGTRPHEVAVDRPGGARVVAEVRSADIRWGAEQCRAVMLRDVTRQRQHERRMRELNRLYEVLSACDRAQVRAADEAGLIAAYCENLVRIGRYRFAWVGYPDDAGLIVPAASARRNQAALRHVTIGPDAAAHPVRRALAAGRPVVDADFVATLSGFSWQDQARRRDLNAMAALPLMDGQAAFGVLAIYADRAVEFEQAQLGLLERLAEDLAYGILTLRARAARQAAEAALNIRNRALEATRNGVMITDMQGPDAPVIYANEALARITGYRREELTGRNPRMLQGGDVDQPGVEEMRYILREAREGTVLLRNYRKDGSLLWNELHVAPIFDDDRRLTHYVGIVNDVTERKQYEEQLEFRSNYDDVTGLPNRNLLRDRLDQTLAFAVRHGTAVAVVLLDLDQFKVVNEVLGHDAGDALLREIGGRLRGAGRAEDTVARLGGDEFAVVMPDCADAAGVAVAAERLRTVLNPPFTVAGREMGITASIGVALYPRDGADGETLVKNADAAMYRAKALGRNNLQFYTAELNARMADRLSVGARLRRALDAGRFVLHYQPQVDLGGGAVIGAEALLRLEEEDGALLGPRHFIEVAEESGLILPIGEWVLAEAAAQARRWQEAGAAGLVVGVNLSVRNLADEQLVAKVEAILRRTGLEAGRLEVEITESAVVADPHKVERRLQDLRALGVRIAIDDFGTGYSSLGYLKRYPFQRLKIDRTFVSDITRDPNDAAIARAVVAMGHSLGMEVIAEGVETEAQLHYLRRIGCDQMQGYLYSRPLPAPALAALLAAPPRLPLAPAEGPPLLLALDDEPNVTRALQRSLRREPYQVLAAHSAEEAFTLLASRRIQVIVADQRMPDMSGTEFLSRVRELYPDVVRLVLSGYTEINAVTQAVNRGWIFKFLMKPWEDEPLRQAIREAFLQHQRQARAGGRD